MYNEISMFEIFIDFTKSFYKNSMSLLIFYFKKSYFMHSLNQAQITEIE